INCLSCEDWGRRINGGLSDRSIYVYCQKFWLPGRANTSRHGWEVPRSGRVLDQDDATQQAADFNVTFNQHGQRDQADRREVSRRSRWSQPPDLLQAISPYLLSVLL